MPKDLDRFSTKAEALVYIHAKYKCDPKCAEDILRDRIPKESYYQKKIMDYIKNTYPNSFVWKEAAGNYSRQGIPDVTAVIEGLYFGFEVKRPYFGVLSVIQEQTIKQINAAGGSAGVCVFPEDAERLIQEAEVRYNVRFKRNV